MKAYCIVTIARQMNGDAVGIRFEKCYKDLSKAQAHADTLSKETIETVQSPQGPVQFSCERGVHEFDIEE